MLRKMFVPLWALWMLLMAPTWAQSPGYHLERLDLQGRAFLEAFGPSVAAPIDPQTPLDVRLQGATDNSLWAHQMVVEDVTKVVDASREWSQKLAKATTDDLGTAKTTFESLTRRLKVSSAAVNLSEQSRTALNFLFLELEETHKALEEHRAVRLAQESSRRRSRVGIGLGLGYGYNGWGHPWGVGRYSPYGHGFGPYGYGFGPYYPGLPYPSPFYPW